MNAPNGPVITGVHHVCLTVTDLDTSMNWYQQLFQAERDPAGRASSAQATGSHSAAWPVTPAIRSKSLSQ